MGARVLENTDTHFFMPHSSPVAGRGDHKIDNTLIDNIAIDLDRSLAHNKIYKMNVHATSTATGHGEAGSTEPTTTQTGWWRAA